MKKFIIVHEERGIYVTGWAFQPLYFTRQEKDNGADIEEVAAFDSEDAAKLHLTESGLNQRPELQQGVSFQAIDLHEGADRVTFEVLRNAGLSHLLPDEPETAVEAGMTGP